MNNLIKTSFTLAILFLFSCEPKDGFCFQPNDLDLLQRYSCFGDTDGCLQEFNGEFSTLEECEAFCPQNQNNGAIVVTVFLYENCPIAQYMCGPLRTTYRYFCDTLGHEMLFRGFSPNAFSTDLSVSQFVVKYDIPFSVTTDYNEVDDEPGVYTQNYLPIVTPEVFVEMHGELVYRGMIDNSYEALGQWSVPTEHYLMDVLTKIVNKEKVLYFETEAIGCFINY